jgi:hypothetical protein
VRFEAEDEGGPVIMDDRGSGRRWRRLTVLLSTLLLAASGLFVFGVAGWAQEEPAETTEQTAEDEQEGLTIDYWEPQVGTRTVYYANDVNDIHGQAWGAIFLGYIDIWEMYPDYPPPYQVFSSYYRYVTAISNMNPVYFEMVGPWYFWMTTPYKVVETVMGIHEVHDASEFPEASYAVYSIVIGSGGVRHEITSYRSNYAEQKEWLEWGYTDEYFPTGSTSKKKEIVHYRDPHNRKVNKPSKMTFPLSVGTAGSFEEVYVEGPGLNEKSYPTTYEVVAEGEITVPGGTFDALLVRYNIEIPEDREDDPIIEYVWVVQDVGAVTQITSLPNVIGPTFGEAIEMYVLESSTAAGGG